MADCQKYFETFDGNIKLRRFAENQVLRDKRDIIVDKLRNRLKEIFEEKEETPPTFESFDQGSYAIGSGVKPLNGDYDIDEGILFDINMEDYSDPVVVKQWVYDALFGHTRDVSIKGPCVTVQYSINNEPVYHVDLPIYVYDRANSGTIYLARGKPGSSSDRRYWEASDPVGLCQVISDRFEGHEAKQFRRTIRYLKRWRDVNFSPDGNAAPVGIGITIAAYNWFRPEIVLVDPFQNTRRPNDLQALLRFVETLLVNFVHRFHEGEWTERFSVTLPVQPYDDPFIRMSNWQMANFKRRLKRLRDVLQYAENKEVDPVDACKELQKVFGDDFPVPNPEDTGRRKPPAILSSSTSA